MLREYRPCNVVLRCRSHIVCDVARPSILNVCIFEWDVGDPALLREAKQVQLGGKGMAFADVSQGINRKELEKHCRRYTREMDTTTILIQALIEVLDSPSGCDTTGIRLSDHDRIQSKWSVQQRRDVTEGRRRWRVFTTTSSTSYQVMTLVISMLREHRSCNVVLCCRSHIVCDVARPSILNVSAD